MLEAFLSRLVLLDYLLVMEAGRLMVAGQLGAWAELIERGPPWRVGGVGRPPAVSFCSSQFLDWVLQPRFSCCLRGQKWSGVSWPLSVPVPECSVQAHGDVMTAFLESSSSFLISPSPVLRCQRLSQTPLQMQKGNDSALWPGPSVPIASRSRRETLALSVRLCAAPWGPWVVAGLPGRP